MIEKWLVFSFAVLFMGCAGNRPTTLGVKEGKFIPCPASPNCVSSQSERPAYATEPLAYKGSPDDARTHLLEVIRSMKRSKLVTMQERYIHAEFTSAVFRLSMTRSFISMMTKRLSMSGRLPVLDTPILV